MKLWLKYTLFALPLALFSFSSCFLFLVWDSNINPNNLNFSELKPPTNEELGHATWTFLHSMVSNIPTGNTSLITLEDNPLELVSQFLHLFVKLYPCIDCGQHFNEMLKRTPPPQKGFKADLEIWLCERHNEVNLRLGKSLHSCKLEDIQNHWKRKG